MKKNKIPKHVAIIMDGNGRWAESKGKNRVKGHIEGANSVKAVVMAAKKIGIKHITLYAFSTENWKRPKEEVEALMKLFKTFLKSERKILKKEDVSLKIIGRKEGVSKDLLFLINEVEEELKDNKTLELNIAFNYGGRSEIVDAVNKMIKKGKEKISEEDLQAYLYNPNLPDPELVIRTSGEFRISNFLLWQIAYSEIYISDVYWPDFREEELEKAVNNYLGRERRFGGLKIDEE